MRITRLYTGSDGESHFEDLDVPLSLAGDIGRLSAPIPARSIIFRETGGDYAYDWHNAPVRQYILILEGAVDIEIGVGAIRRFGPGDILLAEDTHGRGHISRAVDGQPRRSVFVTLE